MSVDHWSSHFYLQIALETGQWVKIDGASHRKPVRLVFMQLLSAEMVWSKISAKLTFEFMLCVLLFYHCLG